MESVEYVWKKEEFAGLAYWLLKLWPAEVVLAMAANEYNTWSRTVKLGDYGFPPLKAGVDFCVYLHQFIIQLLELEAQLDTLEESDPEHPWFPEICANLETEAEEVLVAGGDEVTCGYTGCVVTKGKTAEVRLKEDHEKSLAKSGAVAFHPAISAWGLPHKSMCLVTPEQVMFIAKKLGLPPRRATLGLLLRRCRQDQQGVRGHQHRELWGLFGGDGV
jgi:hypothetical protein